MDNTLAPTENELDKLRADIKAAKRREEFAALKNELVSINDKVGDRYMHLDGAISLPDSEKALKTKRKKSHLVEVLLGRIAAMLSPRPVIGHIISVGLALIALYYVFYGIDSKEFLKYQAYFLIGIQVTAGIAIIKSSTRSLLLPLLALFVGSIAAHQMDSDQTLWHFGRSFYEHLMVIGIIGLACSIITID